jgi:hypothetical protein
MLNALYIVLFSIVINWMISLAILFQVAEDKAVKIRSGILLFLSGIISGYIVYLL